MTRDGRRTGWRSPAWQVSRSHDDRGQNPTIEVLFADRTVDASMLWPPVLFGERRLQSRGQAEASESPIQSPHAGLYRSGSMAENRRDESAAKAEGSDAAANVEAGSIGSGISRISATRPVCAAGEQNLKRGAEPSGSPDFGIFPGSAGGAWLVGATSDVAFQ